MNKLEEAAREYIRQELERRNYINFHGSTPVENAFLAGAEWQKNNMWISINDRDTAIPNDKDILIRMSNGEVRRYNEDWESEFALDGTVSHWMPIHEMKKGEQL